MPGPGLRPSPSIEYGPSLLELILGIRATGLTTLSTAWAKLRLAHALYGTTSPISLRNCCYAAIRYEMGEVVPPFSGPKWAPRPLTGPLIGQIGFREVRPVAFGHRPKKGALGQKEGPGPARIHADARFAR